MLLAVVGGVVLTTRGGDPGGIGGPFTLVASPDGRTVTDRDFRGRYVLLYFGYTLCPDVCPTTLAQVAAALDLMGPDADRIRPVFVTVDPARDTPPVVRAYVAAFSPKLVGLTGTPAQIAAVEAEYRVYAERHVTGPGPEDYTMDHSSILYLIDPRGNFVEVLPADATAAALAATLRAATGPGRRHMIRSASIAGLPAERIGCDGPAGRSGECRRRLGARHHRRRHRGRVCDAVRPRHARKRLVSVSTPDADMAMLHESTDDHGVSKMRDVAAFDVPARGVAAMRPGGVHIMLMMLHHPLRPGDRLPLTLLFADGRSIATTAIVGGPGALVSPAP